MDPSAIQNSPAFQSDNVIQFIVLIILVFLSAFFSSAETALTTVNRVRMRTLAEEGNKRAITVNKILDQYSKMLSAILIGNNIVNLSASSLATTLAMRVNLAVGIATGILTITILILGEIVPKTWAMLSNEKLALFYSGIIYGLMQILTPVIYIVDKVAQAILRLLHIDPGRKSNPMTENELKTYVDVSHEDGVIESEEREMIYNVFDFSDAVAKDIMIPRINMVTVSVEDSYDKVLSVFRESLYTRLPVYREDKDNIIGLINIKDFILTENTENFRVENILRDAHYTYEFKKVADLLLEIREKTTYMTFVLDEYGATVGMLTLEDLLEEIVGEIRDEYDEDEEELIQEVDDRTYLVEASMKLDDINDALDTDLDSEDYDSIGGILIEYLNRLPEDNEEVCLENGIRLKVQGIDQTRISKVLLTLPPKQAEGETDDPETESEESVEEDT
ncbi:MAG: hemolysin family protein [Clostridium sp.]|nr:hemolysin family protein [Acetatifactor muris]MCM1527251.1 hemolysin family protein [Bacteroides sp.]MCM1563054.1 hemolysin family protein [Clostridium sp.]